MIFLKFCANLPKGEAWGHQYDDNGMMTGVAVFFANFALCRRRFVSSVLFSMFFSVLFTALTASAESGGSVNENPLRASARVELSSPDAKEGRVVIDLSLDEPYKAYADRFKLALEDPQGAELIDIKLEPLIQFMDTFTKKMKDGIKKHGTMTATLKMQTPDPKKLKFKLTYQACTTEHCLFPKNIMLEPTIVQGAQASTGAGTGASAVASDPSLRSAESIAQPPVASAGAGASAAGGSSDFDKAMRGGLFSAILFMLIAGFLTSLTPCIYPMIPITLAILGAGDRRNGVRAANAPPRSRLRGFFLSIFYVLGIATTYSLLGVTAASTGALFGSALSNIWVVSTLGILFVLMGLSMYGLFEIQAPAFIRDRLGHGKTETGYGSSYFTGLAAGVVASPCIGPVLVSVLAYIAQTQNRLLGFVLLFSFALGMGVLFIVLGTSSSLISKVPKAGAWMDIVKFVFGTTMIGMALYYVAPVYPEWAVRGLLGLAIVLIASAYGVFAAAETGVARVKKGASVAAFCIGIALLMASALEKTGVKFGALQQASNGAVKGVSQLPWQKYSDDLLKQALNDKKPILIDFWADWCGACHELEEQTFPDARIQAAGAKFALLKVDATEDSPELNKLKQKYGVLGLPTMVFYDPTGKIRTELTVTGFEKADSFIEKMNKAMAQ